MTQLALRGAIYSLLADPFLSAPEDCVLYEPDGIILIADGVIREIGAYAALRDQLPAGVELRHYPDAILMPGFVDAHIHYPQVEIIGSYGTQLLEWLNKYTFPAEARFVDDEHARRIAEFFIAELQRNGTTAASVFCTSAPGSVDAIFEAARGEQYAAAGGPDDDGQPCARRPRRYGAIEL